MKKLISLRQGGFTLIELMIVVGIIGILAAIAIPNFERYQSKARQSESKIALAAIYGGEKAFYSEYTAYAASMDAIGYVPEGLKRYYSVGFTDVHSGTITGYAGALTTANYHRVNQPSAWTDCTNVNIESFLSPQLSANEQTFVTSAVGQIRSGQSCDVWQIDELKILQNTTIAL